MEHIRTCCSLTIPTRVISASAFSRNIRYRPCTSCSSFPMRASTISRTRRAIRSLGCVTVHLKSKLATYANNRRFPLDENERARGAGLALAKRAAEAVALRVFVNGLVAGNDRPLILLGDLNDEPNAVTTTLLLGPEDGSVQREDKGDDVRLYNLAEKITPERRYSRVYKKRKELIDHILATKDLFVRTRSIDSLVEPIEPIDESTEKRRSANFPDHAPVLARFDLDV